MKPAVNSVPASSEVDINHPRLYAVQCYPMYLAD